MALNAYLYIEGELQGKMDGSVTEQTGDRANSSMVIGFSHEVVSPRDAASGLPTGKRQHKPVTLTKEVDKATPLIMNALVNNENLKKVTIKFWQPAGGGGAGKEFQHYTITLTNASIAGIRSEMLNNKYPENMPHKEREHVSFCYQKVEWTWTEGGVTAADDWESANTA